MTMSINEIHSITYLNHGRNLVLHSKPHHFSAGLTVGGAVFVENEACQYRSFAPTAEIGISNHVVESRTSRGHVGLSIKKKMKTQNKKRFDALDWTGMGEEILLEIFPTQESR
jgi:hypothetical protein